MSRKVFFDSNVALSLLIGDEVKADRAEALLADGGTISVQVLNEFVAVARRKGATPWPQIDELLAGLRHLCQIEPVTVETHERAVALARRYGFPIHDASIAASAVLAGCQVLYSEDFQHGQTFDGLTIVNPFR